MTPSSYDWPKLFDQWRLLCPLLVGDDFFPAETMLLHRFLAWFDDGLEAKPGLFCWVLSDVEPEKSASRFALVPAERMRDACCTWLPCQPHTRELLSNDSLTLFSHCTVFVYDDQIIGVAGHRGDVLPAGHCVFDTVFQAV